MAIISTDLPFSCACGAVLVVRSSNTFLPECSGFITLVLYQHKHLLRPVWLGWVPSLRGNVPNINIDRSRIRDIEFNIGRAHGPKTPGSRGFSDVDVCIAYQDVPDNW